MLRVLHLADLHLGWPADFLLEQSESYSRKRDGLLGRICRSLLRGEPQVDLVLLVGDLFDTHHPSDALAESVLADLSALAAAGKAVVTVPGNHDEITYHDSVYQRYRDRWPGLLITNPLPADPERLTVAGEEVYIYSLAYTGGLTKIADYLRPAPRVADQGLHIGAFHGSLDFPSDERGLPLSGAALAAAGYDYVALGHFHSPRLLEQGRTTIAYAGMIDGKGYSDPGCGQLTLVNFAAGQVTLRRLPWPVPKLQVEAVDVSLLESGEQLDERLAALADPELLLRVELSGAAGWLLDREQLFGRHRRSFYHLEIVDDSLYLADDLLETWAAEATVRGQFVRRLLDRLAEAGDDRQRQVVKLSLRRGIAAFLTGGE